MASIAGAPSTNTPRSRLMAELVVLFRRVAVFRLDGTRAVLEECSGFPRPDADVVLSLVDRTPLRSAIEAASPIIGSGRDSGGLVLSRALRIAAARTFAVIPIVEQRRVVALAYADRIDEPLSLRHTAEIFRYCSVQLSPVRKKPRAPRSTRSRRQSGAAPRPVCRRPAHRQPPPPPPGEAWDDALNALLQPSEDQAPTPNPPPNTLHDPAQPSTPLDPAPPSETPADLIDDALASIEPDSPPDASTPVEHLSVPDEDFADACSNATLFETLVETLAPDSSETSLGALPELPGLPELRAHPAPTPPPLIGGPGLDGERAEVAHVEPGLAPSRMTPDEITDPLDDLLDPEEPLGEAWSLAYATAAALPEWSEHSGTTVLPPPRALLVNPDGLSEAVPDGSAVRPVRRWLVPALCAALALFVAPPSFAIWSLAPPNRDATETVVRIPEGESLGAISERLHRAGTIRDPHAFKLVAIALGIDRTLKAGTYRLPQNVFGWEIASELVRGQINLRQLTIPEGVTLDAAASLVADAGLASHSGFIDAATDRALLRELGIPSSSAEGYLFPETYRLAKGLNPRDIVRIMVEQFHAVREELGIKRDTERLHHWVTLASLVEREVLAPKEMPMVAGVFQNRLDREMRLESCATVQYILGEPKAKLTLDDVRIPSPYNTYLNEGLPPAPIASPGVDALRAAAQPAQHDFLFFVAREDGSGTHVFTKNYTEHQRAQAQIQR